MDVEQAKAQLAEAEQIRARAQTAAEVLADVTTAKCRADDRVARAQRDLELALESDRERDVREAKEREDAKLRAQLEALEREHGGNWLRHFDAAIDELADLSRKADAVRERVIERCFADGSGRQRARELAAKLGRTANVSAYGLDDVQRAVEREVETRRQAEGRPANIAAWPRRRS